MKDLEGKKHTNEINNGVNKLTSVQAYQSPVLLTPIAVV